MYSAPRRRPSNDPDSQYARKPVEAVPPGPSSATSGMVIPNKSTIAEEEIQVPYGRDSGTRESNIRDSVVTDGSGNDAIASPVKAPTGLAAFGSSGPPAWDKSPITPLQGGLNALAANFDKRNESALDDDDDDIRTANFDSSTVGGRARSASGGSNSTRKMADTRGGLDREETEKMRRDYEYRITSLQAKVSSLQEEVDQASKVKKDDDERIRELTSEISSIRSKQGEQAAALREAEKRVAEEREARERSEQQAKQSHQQDIHQVADYRKKYERAKTELRGIKATSQLFLQKPKNDDQLPTSRTGAIQDEHITAFQSAADGLLSSGRSDAPSRVLVPMKAVVDAVSSIVEDARSYDLRQRSDQDPPVDYDHIENLCERAEATLSNLVTASRTHATSYGLSPVSLLDAALSHVSACVTELAKLLLIRRSPREGENGRTNGLLNGNYGNDSYGRDQALSPSNMRDQRSRGDMFGQSLSSSPPTISAPSYGSEPVSAGRRDWNDLKPYLDAQSEQLVTAIQGVLTAVRNPSPTMELNENVTQVITIVSSIVAVCRDSLPSSGKERGENILAILTDHCDRLSEVQSERSITKDSRQVMAQSSFAIASVVKDLMKL
ncbi:hypothetical protein M408DRAFT_11773 [Serendipita vermifera MAFF 305830]|uniref:GIT Spa2 homology (SHD) domain-containing protein n=1 Tax=Serendipita vermifera MAFF 305830 TaxID=933852 RepID=A0A0C2X0H6_SERVB|nr:hypothetical protein M408DRAFT_11773 [Serendipita vermifera MAFF 305830]